MNRCALLIEAPGNANNYLTGTRNDILRYKSFLMSPSGGAWDPSEILHTKNPSKKALLNAIREIKTTRYFHIYFSGHGETDKRHEAILQINPIERIALRELFAKNSKQLIILDA